MSRAWARAAALFVVAAGVTSLLLSALLLWDGFLQCVLPAHVQEGCWGLGYTLPFVIPSVACLAIFGVAMPVIGVIIWRGNRASAGFVSCLAVLGGLSVVSAVLVGLIFGAAGWLLGCAIAGAVVIGFLAVPGARHPFAEPLANIDNKRG